MTLRIAIGPSTFGAEDDTPRRMLEEAGLEVVPNPHGRRLTEHEIIHHLHDCDGLVAGLEPLNRRVLASTGHRLKAIARVGIGTTNVDLDAARELGIKVSNTPEPPARAVAELTLGAMICLCRRLVPINAAMHTGEWPKEVTLGLLGARVLLVGYGRIGRRVGELLRVLGAEVLVCDPELNPDSLLHGERLVTLADGLAEAEIISLHASGDRCLLGSAEFDRMRRGVFLLNSARGELVDEEALIDALEAGWLGGVWFDAFWNEPYAGRLLRFPQVLLTPHVATYTRQCRLAMEREAVENLLADLGITRVRP
ncbi:MAG TPA: NAD(P)-dependent oxidoreductase [Candidatus Sumerlaeota bacterium]|nr:NAD(P)-dependent oxidoreductase [Candidatus Sumerlaeota bacterium]